MRPGDASYPIASRLASPAFDGLRPAAVARCPDAADVVACVDWARATGSPITARSGGHSYAGYSSGSGLVVDLGGLRAIAVDDGARSAAIGAGAQLIDIDTALAGHDVAVPGGSCPTVGIAGLSLGGGMGVTGRAFGLTCDNVLAADAVLADGRTVHCDANARRRSLLGAARRWRRQLRHRDRLHLPHPSGRRGDAVLVRLAVVARGKTLAAWMDWIPGLPDEVFTACQLSGAPTTGPNVAVSGLVLGPLSAVDPITAPLVAAIGTPSSRFARTHTYLDAMLIEAGCQGLSTGRVPLRGLVARRNAAALGLPGEVRLLRHADGRGGDRRVDERRSNARTADRRLAGGAAQFDAYGGAINRIAPDATAFVHRRALCSAQYSGAFDPAAPADHLAANRAWLQAMYAALRPAASGAAYQNYIDPTLTDWRQAYYGANYDRLVAVQRRYDPHHLFRFPQAIGA